MRIYDYNIDFEDVENTITYSLSARNLENNLNKREEELCNKISDLEAKLAERNKTIDEINKEFLSVIEDWKQLVEIEKTEKSQLKQQLAEKEKFLERIMSGEYIPANIAEKSLKLSNQTAIEKLEKVKKLLVEKMKLASDKLDCAYYINQQINELKGE